MGDTANVIVVTWRKKNHGKIKCEPIETDVFLLQPIVLLGYQENVFIFAPELRSFCFSVVLVSQHAMLLFDSSATITVGKKTDFVAGL